MGKEGGGGIAKEVLFYWAQPGPILGGFVLGRASYFKLGLLFDNYKIYYKLAGLLKIYSWVSSGTGFIYCKLFIEPGPSGSSLSSFHLSFLLVRKYHSKVSFRAGKKETEDHATILKRN